MAMHPLGLPGERRQNFGKPEPVGHYLKLGFGGAHTESNQRLMYTSA